MYGEGGSWRLEVKMRISGFSMETDFYFTILQSWCCVQNTALELDMSTVNVIELWKELAKVIYVFIRSLSSWRISAPCRL